MKINWKENLEPASQVKNKPVMARRTAGLQLQQFPFDRKDQSTCSRWLGCGPFQLVGRLRGKRFIEDEQQKSREKETIRNWSTNQLKKEIKKKLNE